MTSYKKKIIIGVVVGFVSGLSYTLASAVRQNFGEYKAIRQAARIEMAPHATEKCTKYCDIRVVRIYQNFVLLDIIPDMKECSTDQIQMVMKKNDEGWKFVDLGSFIEIDAMVVNPDGTESPYLSGRESLPKRLFREEK